MNAIIERYQKIFKRCFKASIEAITELQKTVVILNNELRSREKRIWSKLMGLMSLNDTTENHQFVCLAFLKQHLVQQIRNCLRLSTKMKLQPPLEPGDIEVSHRIGKAPAPPKHDQVADSSRSQTRPRPIIARFASRRIKVRVMEVKKRLKRNRQSDDSADQEEEDEYLSASFSGPVYVSDSHTAASAFGKEGPRYEECKAVIRYLGFWW